MDDDIAFLRGLIEHQKHRIAELVAQLRAEQETHTKHLDVIRSLRARLGEAVDE